MKLFISHSCHRILIAAASAALIAEVGIFVSGPDEPGAAPAGTTGTSIPWSTSFSLIATEESTPDPTAAFETAPRAAPPVAAAPPTAAPPPAPPPELKLWYGEPSPKGIPAFVAITNNADNRAVGCVYRTVAVAGPAVIVNYNDTVSFTVTGRRRRGSIVTDPRPARPGTSP